MTILVYLAHSATAVNELIDLGGLRRVPLPPCRPVQNFVPGELARIALTLRHHGKNKLVTIRQSQFAERSRPQFGRDSQQNRLFLIDLAPINENQALIGGNKAAHHVAIGPIVRCYHHAHAARTIDRQDSAKLRVFRHNRMESLPCKECDDIIFQVVITVCINCKLPGKS
jgi:hypothetical protein